MNIYVGNLSYQSTEEDIQGAFGAYGKIDAVRVIADPYTSRSRGFAFVEMPDDTEAQAAIDAMNGKELQGRPLTVNQARPRGSGGGGSGGGGGGGGGGGRRDDY